MNTKFFHAYAKSRKSANKICSIKDKYDSWVHTSKEIDQVALYYFKRLLGDGQVDATTSFPVLDDIIHLIISEDDRKMLTIPFTLDEVKSATFVLRPNKVLGPDGINVDFFQKCWDFLGEDIWRVVEDFKKCGKFVKEINHTLICLIPKKAVCPTMKDFRPISLCNTLYKIISKAMAERLKVFLPKLISEHQNGFTPGREIADSIILVSEVIHSMHKEKIRGMAIKLDVEKAYDQVVWQFLLCVLEKFGFPPQWIACIKFCISLVNFSLLVNGSVCDFFPATNGLRQGDPLSPSIFIIMAEVLGRLIQKKKHLQGDWKGVYIHDQLNAITHSQFADDTMVFGEASLVEAKCILETLDQYLEILSQVMNRDKSQLYLFNTCRQMQLRISGLMRIKIEELHMKYLGIKIDKGCCQTHTWDDVKQSYEAKSS
ncbi:hypothetical protein SUGI_0613840 [Cryptomeria japonica]|nr:hypothetical protein SUGI_0613840 [Cryptomeria japonica]